MSSHIPLIPMIDGLHMLPDCVCGWALGSFVVVAWLIVVVYSCCAGHTFVWLTPLEFCCARRCTPVRRGHRRIYQAVILFGLAPTRSSQAALLAAPDVSDVWYLFCCWAHWMLALMYVLHVDTHTSCVCSTDLLCYGLLFKRVIVGLHQCSS